MNSGFPPSIISVPLPAMLVAIVTALYLPAWATISASWAWNLAFNTLWGTPLFFNNSDNSSELFIEIVPTRTGCPFSYRASILSIIDFIFPFLVLYTKSALSLLITGKLVGITITSSP